jgi:uncharacterized short protein YbdD (DUF466 family)
MAPKPPKKGVKQNKQRGAPPRKYALIASHRIPLAVIVKHCGGQDKMRERLGELRAFMDAHPKAFADNKVQKWLRGASNMLEAAARAAIGMPSYTDGVTNQYEAPPDVPTMPLDGYQLVHRMCLVTKLASSGTTAGGFYADLVATDLKNFTTNQYYRVRAVTSWTTSRGDNAGNTAFAGVSVPVQYGTSGTEVLPIWSENRTPIGQGFAGIKTEFPLGDFPLYSEADTTIICSHFTSLGGTGGITGMPVVFAVEIEALI